MFLQLSTMIDQAFAADRFDSAIERPNSIFKSFLEKSGFRIFSNNNQIKAATKCVKTCKFI